MNDWTNERTSKEKSTYTLCSLCSLFARWSWGLSYSHFINIVLIFALASIHDFHSLATSAEHNFFKRSCRWQRQQHSHAAGGRVGCIQRTSISHSNLIHTYIYIICQKIFFVDVLQWQIKAKFTCKTMKRTRNLSITKYIFLSVFISFIFFVSWCIFVHFSVSSFDFLRVHAIVVCCMLLSVFCWRLSFMTTFCYFVFFVVIIFKYFFGRDEYVKCKILSEKKPEKKNSNAFFFTLNICRVLIFPYECSLICLFMSLMH